MLQSISTFVMGFIKRNFSFMLLILFWAFTLWVLTLSWADLTTLQETYSWVASGSLTNVILVFNAAQDMVILLLIVYMIFRFKRG